MALIGHQPLVSIIILNWNGYNDTIECLESVFQILYPNYIVIVVDNNSSDDSLNKIKSYCGGQIIPKSSFFNFNYENKPISVFEYTQHETENMGLENERFFELQPNKKMVLIKNDKNYGFAEGNNVGIRFTLKVHHPDYVFLLNNDTVVEKDFLTELVKVTERDSKIALAGPKNLFYEKKGRNDIISFLGGKVNLKKYPGYFHIGENLIDNKKYSEGIIDCDWITGASLMIRVKGNPIKTLNSKLFFGCEDVDIALKLKKKGYKVVSVLSSKIWHKCGVSRKLSTKRKIKRLKRETKTNLSLLKMHNPYYNLYLPVYMIQLLIQILYNRIKD